MEKFSQSVMLQNDWFETTVPDLKVGDTVLFEHEPDEPTQQGHTVTSIFCNGIDNIIVCYIPEWTTTRSFSMFNYELTKFRVRK